MKKLITAAAVFAMILVFLGVSAFVREKNEGSTLGGYAVSLNEIQKLAERGDNTAAARCAEELRKKIASQDTDTDRTVLYMCGICLVFLAGVVIYVRFAIEAPFLRLSGFAERVALGDLEEPLRYERNNLFGKFTWAFDSMRNEILKARACEKEAIENNKTVIASLSHDIKTPVSSIRAYAEALELGMDGDGCDTEKRARYISVMIRKCDEVSRLTEDMLEHSLSELDRLKMSPERFELNGALSEILEEISAERSDAVYERPSYRLEVYADRNRTAQLVENIVNNARKYAKTRIDISVTRDEHFAYIRFRDYGGGIPDDELPFVFGKFYRGKNSGREKGAGLGLFIVKYITEQSGGSVKLRNCDKGLEVTVGLPLAEEQGEP